MRRTTIAAAISILSAALAMGAAAHAQGRVAHGSDWLYVVETRSTDPANEEGFNRWYDDIDIPDVLEVPGFRRARRAQAEAVDGHPELTPDPAKGNYVAIYDIDTGDIDKTIVDLYVAARRMSARGRDTDLLKVTEANYYRHVAGSAGAAASRGTGTYLLAQKILCCAGKGARADFASWFRKSLMPRLDGAGELVRADLYLLYRVMETEGTRADEIPHFLVVYELQADSATQAFGGLSAALERVKDGQDRGYKPGDAAIYRLRRAFLPR